MTDTDNTITLASTDETALALAGVIKSAVNGAGKYTAYAKAHDVTRESVKDHARALAVFTYPNENPIQKKDGARTKFGNAVQAAGYGLRAALGAADKDKATPDYLALVSQAVKNAYEKGEIDPDAIMRAVEAVLFLDAAPVLMAVS